MALYGLLGLIALGVLLGLQRWRQALFVMVAIAAIQDPVRKLVPGTPGYLVLASAPVFAAAIFGLVSTRRDWWTSLARTFPAVGSAINIFVLACIPPALISATYGPGSWLLTVMGVFAYGTLLMSIVVGFNFARDFNDLRRLLGFYCIVTLVMLSGGLIEYLGLWPGSRVIGTDALDMKWVRFGTGYIVEMIAGFYRSPDVMGWHAAATAMLALVLAMTAGGPRRWLWLAVSAAAVVTLLLCGRRKMVYMLPFFGLLVGLIYWAGGHLRRRIGVLGLLLVPLLSMSLVGDWLGADSTYVRYYTDNPDDTVDQVEKHGFASVIGTYEQAGFFGSGLGVATPGSHHLKVARPKVWQESGPSRIMVELGVPGLLALLAVIVSVLVAAWSGVKGMLQSNAPAGPYAVALLAFFLANAGSLVVSGQILADPFIASFVGLSLGMVLSLVRLSAQRMQLVMVAAPTQRTGFQPGVR